jgi:hypothetical protein
MTFLEQMEGEGSSSPETTQALFRQSIRPRGEDLRTKMI